MTLLDVTPTALQALWLILVAVLWIGYLVLEGFDYGVAMLLPFVGKNDKERRVLVNTIGPVWDGNQVWLLTAGGAMFAAFSGWYATLFSALYLPLFLILLGLIIRGVAFEYRGKRPGWTWRNRWDWAAAIGSLLPPLVFGVGFANFLIGLPLKNVAILGGATTVPLFDGETLWAGPLFGLFSWFGLVGGITFVLVFLTHGALYAALKTKGEIHDRLMKLAVKLGLITAIPGIVFVLGANIRKMLPGQLDSLRAVAWIAGILLLVLFVGAIYFVWKGREGIAFILTGGVDRDGRGDDLRAPLPGPRLRQHRPQGAARHHHGIVLTDDADADDRRGGHPRPDRPAVPDLDVHGVPPPSGCGEHPGRR